MRYIALLMVASLAAGCVSTYKQQVLMAPTAKLQQGQSIVIATPANGSYEGREYAGSGQSTALAFRTAFARHSNTIAISAECRDLNCLKSKQSNADGYFVVPEILHWEDRNTEWSGIKDKLEVKVAVYDAKDGRELSTTIISGKSKWATFGGDHPQDLLPEPVGQYVESLY